MTQAEFNLLWEACALLAVEARDHEDNRKMDKAQRLRIAELLRGYIAKAEKAIEQIANQGGIVR
jgi:hypothetical protein